MNFNKKGNNTLRNVNRRAVGMQAEEAAVQYLEERGYSIIARNWYCSTGELDIIAKQLSQLVIVEVRSKREGSKYGTALEAVTPSKIKQVRNTATYFLYKTGISGANVRFDVIAITTHEMRTC